MNHPNIPSLIKAIRELPAAEWLGAAERLASHADPEYRSRALQVLKSLGYDSANAFCLFLLADPVWYVRCSACEFAYLNSVGETAEMAISLLETDPHEIVRSYAALSLAQTGRGEHIPRLQDLVGRVTGFSHEDEPISDILSRSIDMIKERFKLSQ